VSVIIGRKKFEERVLEELRKVNQGLYEKPRAGLERKEPWARVARARPRERGGKGERGGGW
jgi:hypothetical protein